MIEHAPLGKASCSSLIVCLVAGNQLMMFFNRFPPTNDDLQHPFGALIHKYKLRPPPDGVVRQSSDQTWGENAYYCTCARCWLMLRDFETPVLLAMADDVKGIQAMWVTFLSHNPSEIALPTLKCATSPSWYRPYRTRPFRSPPLLLSGRHYYESAPGRSPFHKQAVVKAAEWLK